MFYRNPVLNKTGSRRCPLKTATICKEYEKTFDARGSASMPKRRIDRRSTRTLIDRLHERVLQRRILEKSLETAVFIVGERLKTPCMVCTSRADGACWRPSPSHALFNHGHLTQLVIHLAASIIVSKTTI